jgi:hypothetical protein
MVYKKKYEKIVENKSIHIAEESIKTRKVREKLKKHLEKIDSQVTQQELNRKLSEIHRWISRHASHRVSIKAKSFSLFDENQNTAKISQKVAALVFQLKTQFEEARESLENHGQSS